MLLTRRPTVVLITLGIVIMAAAVMLLRQSKRIASFQRQHLQDERTIAGLRRTLSERNLEPSADTSELNAPRDNQALLARREVTIARLNRELSEAHANVAQLHAEVADSNEEHNKALASANELHQKELQDLQGQLSTLKQQADATESELQTQSQSARQRVTALEEENAKLRSDSSQSAARTAEYARLVASLDDVNRRRDTYLTSIIRRYRDITGQFRAMGGMLDSSHDPNPSAFSGEALSRIQSAVTQAEDDLRQLNELTAQARQIEKKLAKK
jgi:hypothetical protein